ncbi:MAG TPA: hypothetical protein VFD10_03870 [Atribacterota bacterium]|nr:hypothetical protein [Atribacterota bacterium]
MLILFFLELLEYHLKINLVVPTYMKQKLKKAMVSIGKKVVVVAGYSKFNSQGLRSFASFEDIDILITSSLVDMAIIDEIRNFGVEVIIAQVKE